MTPIKLPLANFSHDLDGPARLVAAAAALLAAGAVAAAVYLALEAASYREGERRMAEETRTLTAQTDALRQSQTINEPDSRSIAILRQRIASLNALDFGQAPAVTRVLFVLEQVMPAGVALQTLDYDRSRGALEIVAVSESSEDLTAFFDIASRNPFFKTVRLVDKKQAGTSDQGVSQFQVRLSIGLLNREPRA
jgi:hypothetical protein